MQRNGRVNSGDVSIFYRAFGTRGQTPILLMHGDVGHFGGVDIARREYAVHLTVTWR